MLRFKFESAVLCHRYGPTLKSAGFADLSATHLEYNEAREAGLPIHMYVRDRLEADYRIQKKNRTQTIDLTWVKGQQDRPLLNLLQEHQELAKSKAGSNWFDTFSDSIALKTLIKRDFGPLALRTELRSLILENKIPIVVANLGMKWHNLRGWSTDILFKNVGAVPAYNLSWKIESSNSIEKAFPMLAPEQHINQHLGIFRNLPKSQLTLTYYTAQGYRAVSEYELCIMTLADGSNIVIE